jgi:hypothetical protein
MSRKRQFVLLADHGSEAFPLSAKFRVVVMKTIFFGAIFGLSGREVLTGFSILHCTIFDAFLSES